jgi:hypothetical protein
MRRVLGSKQEKNDPTTAHSRPTKQASLASIEGESVESEKQMCSKARPTIEINALPVLHL